MYQKTLPHQELATKLILASLMRTDPVIRMQYLNSFKSWRTCWNLQVYQAFVQISRSPKNQRKISWFGILVYKYPMEYTGVAIGGENDAHITKCLKTYARSLSKRYVKCYNQFFINVPLWTANQKLIDYPHYFILMNCRYQLQSWQPERLEKSQSRVRQRGRLQKVRLISYLGITWINLQEWLIEFCIRFEIQLKTMRDKAVFSKPNQLFKLSAILENACSDDETNLEGTSEGPNWHGLPCLVLNLEWRSKKLSHVCVLLDGYMEQRKASIPNSV